MEPRKKRMLSALLAVLLAVLLPAQARAVPGRIDVDRPASLTVEYLVGEKRPAPNVGFSLYRVAEVSESARWTPTGGFERYVTAARLNGADTETWEALSATLEGYVLVDKSLQPLKTGYTDSEGRLTFSALKPGLYLLLGGQYVDGSKIYTAAASLISLPDSDGAYAVDAEPKNTVYDSGDPPDGTVSRKVWKWWDDAGSGSVRPAQVTVQLLDRATGRVYRTAVLKESNHWQYIWTGLPAGFQWTVVERPVAGYTAEVRQAGATFIVTNTSGTGGPDTPDDPGRPDPPGNPDSPGGPDAPDEPGTPDAPDRPGNPDRPGAPGGSKLPQTGVLWWPVPVLLAAGLTLVILGFVRRREDDAE